MSKVFNSENSETQENVKVYFRTPKEIREGVKRSKVLYLEEDLKLDLVFETEVFSLTHGISRSPKGLHYVQIDLNDNDPLCIFLEHMDELAMGRTVEKSKKWFGFNLDESIVDQIYISIVKTSKGKKYVKLGWDKETLELKDRNGSHIRLEDIKKNSNVKIRVHFESIEFYARQIVPKFNIISLENFTEDEENKEATNISNFNVNFMQNGNEETELYSYMEKISKKVEQKEEVIQEQEEENNSDNDETEEDQEQDQEQSQEEEQENLEQNNLEEVENISVNEDEEENVEHKEETVPTGHIEGSLENSDVEEIAINEDDTQEEKMRKFSNVLGKAVEMLGNTDNGMENSITSNSSKKSFVFRLGKKRREHTQTT